MQNKAQILHKLDRRSGFGLASDIFSFGKLVPQFVCDGAPPAAASFADDGDKQKLRSLSAGGVVVGPLEVLTNQDGEEPSRADPRTLF